MSSRLLLHRTAVAHRLLFSEVASPLRTVSSRADAPPASAGGASSSAGSGPRAPARATTALSAVVAAAWMCGGDAPCPLPPRSPAAVCEASSAPAPPPPFSIPAVTVRAPKVSPYVPPPPAPSRGSPASPATVRRRVTSVGRFAYLSETSDNMSVPVILVALGEPDRAATRIDPATLLSSGGDPLARRRRPLLPGFRGLTAAELDALFLERGVYGRHWRTRACLSGAVPDPAGRAGGADGWDGRHFSVRPRPPPHWIVDTLHPRGDGRQELRRRIESALVRPLDLTRGLLEGSVSSGPVGSSGVLHGAQVAARGGEMESLVLLRLHHVLCDGVSFGAILTDLCDERDEILDDMKRELAKRRTTSKTKLSFLARLLRRISRAIQFLFSAGVALSRHAFLVLTASNPFDAILEASSMASGLRSVSWVTDCTSVEEAKTVAKALCAGATLNDLFVSCVSAAVAQQLEWHDRQTQAAAAGDGGGAPPRGRHGFNIVVPVHLLGGALPPGTEIGNKIGALVARVPGSGATSAPDRLAAVHSSLTAVKGSPAPLLGYIACKFFSDWMPTSVASAAMRRSAAGSVAVVSNVRSRGKPMHWNGRRVASIMGFVPLTPGVPIGITVTSYGGEVTLGLNADRRAVPDPDLFLKWVLEEYGRLSEEAGIRRKKLVE